MNRHHGYSNSYKEKHLNGSGLHFQTFSTLSSCLDTSYAGRHDAELCLDLQAEGDCTTLGVGWMTNFLQLEHIYFNKATAPNTTTHYSQVFKLTRLWGPFIFKPIHVLSLLELNCCKQTLQPRQVVYKAQYFIHCGWLTGLVHYHQGRRMATCK